MVPVVLNPTVVINCRPLLNSVWEAIYAPPFLIAVALRVQQVGFLVLHKLLY
jgi:hypothetical protein